MNSSSTPSLLNKFFVAFLFSLFLGLSGLQAESKALRLAFIPYDGTSSAWLMARTGAEAAAQEFSNDKVIISVAWFPPQRPNDRAEQSRLVENAVGSGFSALILAPCDPKALIPSVELAVRQKSPVIIVDSPLDYPLITSTVATHNFQAGGEMAGILGKVTGGRGKVLGLRFQDRLAFTEKRENGFLDGMRKIHDAMQVIIPNGVAGPTAEAAYQTTKGFLARYGTEIVGLFSPHPLSTEGALRALREAKLTGDKVKLVGFGQSEELCAALELGELQGLIAEDYFLWGYLSVKAALESLRGKPVKPRIEVPFALVLKENLSDPIIQMILGKIPRAKIDSPAPTK